MPSPSNAERVAYCGARSIAEQITFTRRRIAKTSAALQSPRTKPDERPALARLLLDLRDDLADWENERPMLEEASGDLLLDAVSMKAFAEHLAQALQRADEPLADEEESIPGDLYYEDLAEVEA